MAGCSRASDAERMTTDNVPILTEADLIPLPGGGWALLSDYETWAAALPDREDRSISAWLAGPPRPDDHLGAVREYGALTRAMAVWPPACAGDARFIADGLDVDERLQLAEICATRCRVRAQCDAYARKAHPLGGIWDGKFYTPKARTHDIA